MGQGINGRKGASAAVAERPLDRLTGRLVKVGGEPQLIGKLSVDQWLGLAGLAMDTASGMTPEDRERFQALQKGEQVQERGTFQSLRRLVNKDSILGIYAVLVERDVEWCSANFDIEEFAEVLDATDEFNDLRKVWASFSRVIGRWRTSPATSSQPLSPSQPEATESEKSASTA